MKAFRTLGVQLLALGLLTGIGLAQGPFKHPKMSSAIVDAVQSGQLEQAFGQQPAWERSMNLTTEGLHVYIQMVEVSEATLRELQVLGVTIELTDPAQHLVQARIPLTQLAAVANLPSVSFLRLPDYEIHNRQGSIGTQGDAIIRAHLQRQQLGISGTGVQVGVISDGVNGLSSSLATGDLPATGITMPSEPLTGTNVSLDSPLPGGVPFITTPLDRLDLISGSEGRALLEIIHDVAPGAQLYFAPIGGTSLAYRRAVRWLVAQGVKVIADDVVFLNAGSYDGTSVVAQEASAAVASGVAYFQAVGNFAQQHYGGLFTDTDGDTFHEFDVSLGLPRVDNAGETLNVIIPPGGTVGIFLQWNDPFGVSTNDYDLCVHDPADAPSAPLFCSTSPQTGTHNPTEALVITRNPLALTPGTLGIRINRVGMAAPKHFDLFIVFTAPGSRMDEFIVPDGSVPNKADAGGGVISVGAVPWVTPGNIEAFSSRGPTRDGRLKPEIVGPDGVSTSVPGLSPFFGTSAATPHVAGVAALLLSQNPGLTPSQLADELKGTAVDLGSSGPDDLFGFGRLDAFSTAPRGSIAFDRPLYRTGDTFHLSASLQSGLALNTGDVYVFALLPPDWSTPFSLIPAPGGGVTGVEGVHPIAVEFTVPSASGEFFQGTFSGGEPPGLYIFGIMMLPSQTPLPLNADFLEQTIIFYVTVFEFLP